MESISFQTACARELSLKFIYIHTERLPELESWTSSSRQYFCASRTLGCFVPLGWASLFTLILSMRQGSILSRTAPGCVTRHTRHASVTHFRPILGNIVEVTLVTSPNLYINSHAKGTGFPLVRITIMIPP